MGNNVQDVGIRLRADGVAEASNGAKLTAQSIQQIGQAAKQATNDTRSLSESQRQGTSEGERYVKALQDEANALGKTRLELKGYQGDQMQLTAAQREAAREAITRIRRHEEETAAMGRVREAAGTMARAVTLGATALGGWAVYQTGKAINTAAEMATLSEKTGVAVEDLSTLKYAADLSETSMEALARSMQQLPKSLVEAQNKGSAAGRGFAFLGIDPSQLKTQQQAIDAIADAISRVQDPMAASAALQLIFKRNGEELLPFFKQGAEGLRRLADEGKKFAEISTADATAAKEFKDELVRLNYEMTEMARELGGPITRGMNDFMALVREAKSMGSGGIAQLILGPPLDNPGQQLNGITRRIEELRAIDASLRRPTVANRLNNFLGSDLEDNQRQIAALEDRKRLLQARQRLDVDRQYAGNDYRDGKDRRLDAAGKTTITGMPNPSGGNGNGDRVTEGERYIQTLLKETETLGMTSAELRRYQLVKAGLTGAQREAALAQIRTIERYEAEKSAVEKLARVEQDRARLQSANDAAYEQQIEAIGTAAERDREATEQLRRHNQEIGLTAEQLRALRIARADETVAKWESQAADAAAEPGRARELELLERRIKAAREYAAEVRRGTSRESEVEREQVSKREADKEAADTKRRAESLEREITGGLMRSFESGKDAGRAFFDTLRNMAKTTILEPMLKPLVQPIAEAAGGLGSSLGSGLGGWLGNLFGGGGGGGAMTGGFPDGGDFVLSMFAHGGGKVGSDALRAQSVPASVFAGARRMHTGGIAGDEVPTILKRGEEVLTQSDPRHRDNGGGGTVINMPFSPVIDARGAAPGTAEQMMAMMRAQMPGLLVEHRRVVSGIVAKDKTYRAGRG